MPMSVHLSVRNHMKLPNQTQKPVNYVKMQKITLIEMADKILTIVIMKKQKMIMKKQLINSKKLKIYQPAKSLEINVENKKKLR